VGVRVEVHNDIMQDLCDVIYDPTFFIQTGKYDDQTRTFCTNQGGFVSLESYSDFVCVNGHAYHDRKSINTNFAFLSKVVLTEPVTDNQAYGEAIGRLATLIGGGKPILQRFGDLKRGRRSTWNRISKGYMEPTLTNVVCGDIAMALPERILTNIIDGLQQLNSVVPGVSNDETLLYAPEIKFFATQVETSPQLETEIKGMYVAGDGPGVAGNIVSAAATGLIPAKAIPAVRRLRVDLQPALLVCSGKPGLHGEGVCLTDSGLPQSIDSGRGCSECSFLVQRCLTTHGQLTMPPHAPRVCIIYYSLSGQSRGLINLLAEGLRSQGIDVFIEQVKVRRPIGFPFFSIVKTVKMMVLTFFRKRIAINPLSRSCFQPFDLTILAGPTWSYNPSGPVLDLLDRYGDELFSNKRVVPLISCRGYYRLHDWGLRRKLQKCGARLGKSIIFHHPVREPWSTIGVFLKSAGYQPEKMNFIAGHYPHFGHNVDQLLEARNRGTRIGEQLHEETVALEN
jgi:hypothetical protein